MNWNTGRRTLCALAAGAVLSSSAAQAQEVLTGWEGLYGGLVLGYAWTDADMSIPPNTFSESYGGISGGIVGGYNFNLNEFVIAGIEADLTFADLLGDMSLARHKVSLVGRLGYLVTPTMLVFGVAGIAGGQYKAEVTATGTSMSLVFDDDEVPQVITTTTAAYVEKDKRLWGYTLGAGIEKELSGPVAARIGLEYRYTDFEEWNFVVLGQGFSIQPVVQEVRLRAVLPF